MSLSPNPFLLPSSPTKLTNLATATPAGKLTLCSPPLPLTPRCLNRPTSPASPSPDEPSWIERACVQPFSISGGKYFELSLPDLKLPSFHPDHLESYSSLRSKLDGFRDAGITEGQFRRLFSQCRRCRRFMTRRTREYHSCPALGDPAAATPRKHDPLLLRLECYGSGPGVSGVEFKTLFVECLWCQKYMTRYSALNHGDNCEQAQVDLEVI